MPSRAIADLHPTLQPLAETFLARCKAAGLDIRLTCTYRSKAEQDALYAQGRNGDTRPRVTSVKGGGSRHNDTLPDGRPGSSAFDYAVFKDGKPDWKESNPGWLGAGKIAESLGLE